MNIFILDLNIFLKANAKFNEGKRIMAKEVKTQADYDKAEINFSEAINLLSSNENISYKFYAARGNLFM